MASKPLRWNSIKIPHSMHLGDNIRKSILAGEYEQEDIAGALAVITSEDRVIEMGAGLGVVGSIIGRHCRPRQLIAFEANLELVPGINSIYELNRLTHSHRIENALLVSDPNARDAMPFHVHKSFLGSSTKKSENHTKYTVEIPTIQWDTLRRKLKPTVLVIDIEGGEANFLKHANLEGVRTMVIEFHPHIYGRLNQIICKCRLHFMGFAPLRKVSTSTAWTCIRPHRCGRG